MSTCIKVSCAYDRWAIRQFCYVGSTNVTCHELFFLVLLQVKWMCQQSARCCQYLSISCMLFVILLKVGPKPRLFHPIQPAGRAKPATKLCRDLSSPKIRRKETAQRPKHRLTGVPAAKQPGPKELFCWLVHKDSSRRF